MIRRSDSQHTFAIIGAAQAIHDAAVAAVDRALVLPAGRTLFTRAQVHDLLLDLRNEVSAL